MAKKPSLGRGIDSLFVDNSIEEQNNDSSGKTLIRLSKIEPNPNQPRREFEMEALSELADSISRNGLIQPIAVRPSSNEGYYTIIAGERRWRASKMAGLSEIPAIIMDIDDKKASELALIENIQREDLNPIEEAKAYRSLIEEYDLTQSEVAAQVGKSRVAVTNAMRILDLPEEVLSFISNGNITPGHGRAILGLKDPDEIVPLAQKAASEEMSVRAVEEAVRRINSKRPVKAEENISSEKLQLKEYYKAIENKATEHIGSRVKITDSNKNKSISVSFSSNEELEEILIKLCGNTIFDDIK
ncbi:MAG: ParB/RepB/Spo0J family partition protein [Clostridia bacterium]|nr:ParB/RepB/Spo0J family partition protein [Clostridia bacterium]